MSNFQGTINDPQLMAAIRVLAVEILNQVGTRQFSLIGQFEGQIGAGDQVSQRPATPTQTGQIQLTGDLGGTATYPLVTGVQDVDYSATPPTLHQFYVWNGTTMTPYALEGDGVTITFDDAAHTITLTAVGGGGTEPFPHEFVTYGGEYVTYNGDYVYVRL